MKQPVYLDQYNYYDFDNHCDHILGEGRILHHRKLADRDRDRRIAPGNILHSGEDEKNWSYFPFSKPARSREV